MKSFKIIALLLGLSLFLSANLFAQEQEMTEEEWQSEMNRLAAKKTELTSELNALQNDVNNLKSSKAGLQAVEDCTNELYSMVGASQADVERFRKQVDMLDSKINRKEAPRADRVAELANLQASKLSALPEFYDKVHNQMQRSLDNWKEAPTEIMYTVVKGDHLWGIAKKKEHYGNGFAWPVIYQANRDQIKNPDLIYPKQMFKIPNLTEAEKEKYDKARKNYKPAPPSQGN